MLIFERKMASNEARVLIGELIAKSGNLKPSEAILLLKIAFGKIEDATRNQLIDLEIDFESVPPKVDFNIVVLHEHVGKVPVNAGLIFDVQTDSFTCNVKDEIGLGSEVYQDFVDAINVLWQTYKETSATPVKNEIDLADYT